MEFELRRAKERLEREQRERKEKARLKVERENKLNKEALLQRQAIETAQRSRRLDAAHAQHKADEHEEERSITGGGVAFSRILEAVPFPGTGDKIKLPPSCFRELSDQSAFDKGPVHFRLSVVFEDAQDHAPVGAESPRTTHSGVLEFSAGEGSVGLPPPIWARLFLSRVPKSPLVEVLSVWLPKGTFAELRPDRAGFSDIPDHRAILETSLRHHTTLSEGDTVAAFHGDLPCSLQVLRLLPSPTVSILETDIEVDIVDPGPTPGLASAQGPLDRLTPGRSEGGTVQEGCYVYYKFVVEEGMWEGVWIDLTVETDGGDTDLYAAKHPLVFPTRHSHGWSSHGVGSKRLAIAAGDKGAGPGEYTVAVYGFEGAVRYSISVEVGGRGGSVRAAGEEEDTEDCGNCRRRIPKRTFGIHEVYCRRNNIVCGHPGCGAVLRVSDSGDHVHCERCGKALARAEADKHMKVFHEPFYCPCGVLLEKDEMVRHQAGICPLRKMTCRFCGDMVEAGETAANIRDRMRGLTEHESLCGSRTAPCDSCGRSVMLKEMDIHHVAVHQKN